MFSKSLLSQQFAICQHSVRIVKMFSRLKDMAFSIKINVHFVLMGKGFDCFQV